MCARVLELLPGPRDSAAFGLVNLRTRIVNRGPDGSNLDAIGCLRRARPVYVDPLKHNHGTFLLNLIFGFEAFFCDFLDGTGGLPGQFVTFYEILAPTKFQTFFGKIFLPNSPPT